MWNTIYWKNRGGRDFQDRTNISTIEYCIGIIYNVWKYCLHIGSLPRFVVRSWKFRSVIYRWKENKDIFSIYSHIWKKYIPKIENAELFSNTWVITWLVKIKQLIISISQWNLYLLQFYLDPFVIAGLSYA